MLKGGLMLHSTADQHTTKNCTPWDLWEDYTPTQKANLKQFAMASFDALQVIQSDNIPSTGFSGPGKSARVLWITARVHHCGHISLGWTMAGFLKTRVTLWCVSLSLMLTNLG